MIKVFRQTDKDFSSNGDCVVSPLRAVIHKEDNGDYYLSLETGLQYVDYLVKGNIVVANTPQGDQPFRVGNVTKTNSRIETQCDHVFFDSKNYLIVDSYVVDKDCADALEHLNTATEPQSEFTTGSDIETVDSYRCVRKSLCEAINEVLSRWGGHLVRDGFDIQIKESIGQDNGITIQYKKNLREITCEENWDDVVTKILPVGQDGIMLNAIDPTASIYISSETQYDIPYTKTVSFNQNLNREDYQTEEQYKTALVADLRAQAEDYLEKNCVPNVNYTLNADLDRVTDIGDTIEVIDERLGLSLLTQVISFEYDCILEQYTEVEFGNFKQKLSNLINYLNENAEKTSSESAKDVQDQILGILNDSYVIYDGNRILIVDSLPKETATNVIVIDNTGIGFSQDGISGVQTAKWNIMNGDLSAGSASIDGVVSANTVSATTLNVNGQAIQDSVKAKGTTNGWKWKKYTSGTVEAWKTVSINSADITWSTFMTDLYSGSIDVTYPFNVADAVIEACLNDSGDIGWVASAKAVNATKSNVTIIRQGNTGTMTINIMVKGSEPSV